MAERQGFEPLGALTRTTVFEIDNRRAGKVPFVPNHTVSSRLLRPAMPDCVLLYRLVIDSSFAIRFAVPAGAPALGLRAVTLVPLL